MNLIWICELSRACHGWPSPSQTSIGTGWSEMSNCMTARIAWGLRLRWRKNWRRRPRTKAILARSEEHTSELQSRFDLVCRLLLEKKKNIEEVDHHHRPGPRDVRHVVGVGRHVGHDLRCALAQRAADQSPRRSVGQSGTSPSHHLP